MVDDFIVSGPHNFNREGLAICFTDTLANDAAGSLTQLLFLLEHFPEGARDVFNVWVFVLRSCFLEELEYFLVCAVFVAGGV
jgi:hypothetical protein